MIPDDSSPAGSSTRRAPDAILAELWEVKRQINRAADYRIDALVQMAYESAERIRRQWRQKNGSSGAPKQP